MRIQHNIMAMNAYRNYTNNASSLASNLEKLSSGYQINRAGDNAAGLAISEKMRAQISGLDQAQDNVKDGISLIKTAEGALQEVQDMLNRMVTLATQSANGTYENEVDREALQAEVDQLRSEIDRIAESANFNGRKLLDGSLDSNGAVVDTTSTFTSLTSLDLYGVNDQTVHTTEDGGIYYHKDAAESAKTSFSISLDGINHSTSVGTTIDETFGLRNATGANVLYSSVVLSNGAVDTTNSKTLDYSVTADSNGITGESVAKAVYDAAAKNDGKVYILSEDGKTAIEYEVALDGDNLTFTMTDDGYTTAAGLTGTDANAFRGNFNVVAVEKDLADNTLDTPFGQAIDTMQQISTRVITAGSANSNEQMATFMFKGFDTTGVKDGQGLQIGDEYYVWALSDETYEAAYADNVTVVDLRDIAKAIDNKVAPGTTAANGITATYNADGSTAATVATNGAAGTADTYTALTEALNRLSVAAADNEMFSVQVHDEGAGIILTEKTTYDGDADLTSDAGIKKVFKSFTGVNSSSTTTREAGSDLTLQIGDTSDSYNQLTVSIKAMDSDALGIGDMSVATLDDAQAAIDIIKTAINNVSSQRGDLGAIQNRLEHTQNNLSVMEENITDAESSIRDTDIAEEMTEYTKNNILLQSAQAMLAQANSVPQGVLSLLQ